MKGRKTRKSVPWKGWGKIVPKGKERTTMYKKCGKKCFLGTKSRRNKQHPTFPICKKKTCKISTKGLWAAYIRAKQWGKVKSSYNTSKPSSKRSVYTNVARRSKKMLKQRGYSVKT